MATATEYYPPVGFHFRVEFQDIESQTIDTYFQEVSGLSFDIETETVKEGGENRFTYQLPTRTKYPNLVLKRGLFTDSSLISWVNDAVETMEVQLATVIVTLLNEQHEPLQSYRCVNAWPQKWSLSNFNAQNSELVVETLELVYQYYRIQ
ncbi:MAG: phage tail protein [Bacteroidota bacterium]